MAFNPFNVFRRNQKILFGILTVFIMFMFTLQFGQGDFFDFLPRWLGSKTRKGEVLAQIDGSKVYESEVNQLQTRRTLANQYMSEAAARAGENLRKYVQENLNRVSGENKPIVQQVLTTRPYYVSQRTAQLMSNPQLFQQFVQMGLITPETIAREREETLAFLQARLLEIARTGKDADQDVAKVTLSLIQLDQHLGSATRPGQYFTNLPSEASYQDEMAFLLWSKKAKDLGISLTDEAVAELVNSEFHNRLTNDDLKAIEDNLKGKHGYSPEVLRDALRQEFQVRGAQAAVLGPDYLRPSGRVYDAPYDYYQYYKDQTTTARYGLITVPVENYLDKVTGTPSESELRDIFRKYRNEEPNPALARPGLKEPRRLKLQWIEVTGREPFYKTAAEAGAMQSAAMTRANGFLALGSALGGSTTASLLGAPAALTLPDPVLAAKYAEYVRDHQDSVRANWYSTPFLGVSQPIDLKYPRPENAGGVVSPAAAVGEVYEANRQTRLQTLPAAFLAPVMPGVGLPSALLTTAVVQARVTQPLPLEAVRTKLASEVLADIARTIAQEDLTKFQTELAKLSNQPSEARAYVEKFVKERGIQTGQSEQFRDQFHLGDDPGLKVLKDRVAGPNAASAGPVVIGRQFFFEQDPLTGQLQPATGMFKPQPFPSPFLSGPTRDESALLVWRVAEQAAEIPRDFNTPEVKAKAEAAWRRLEARKLARQAAEELAKQMQNLGSSFAELEPKVRDRRTEFASRFASPEAKERISYFEVEGVAPLVSTPLPTGGMPRQQVGPFQLTPTANIPYPTVKMAEELIQAKDKPLSSTVVLADQPEDRYYVAVLLDRNEPSVGLFEHQVYGPSAPFFGDLGAVISRRHQEELKKQAREQAVALLKAQYKYEKEHAKVNEKSESSEE